MSDAVLVKKLFRLPDEVHKGDFVVKLLETLQRPEDTARTFVVTKPLQSAFDRALGLVRSALENGRSQAAYIHGSFGSGKSHFMALLSLLMNGNEAAWRVPELHPLREKHPFVGTKKLLQLHFHMIDKSGIESAIFDEYVQHVREHHPEAVLPGLFADEKLFEDARSLLEQLGDEPFFERLNEGSPSAEGWGDLAQGWDRERFEACATSTNPREREVLFSALAKTWFTQAQSSSAYVDLDTGLGVITRHASELGYDAVLLYLDELILWLWGLASDPGRLHREVQKMVKLVEAQEAARPIPVVSFIARQRDLAEMVGEDLLGAEHYRLTESMSHWEGRYDKITLEDRNLPAIIEKRILKPKDEDAAEGLKAAFERMRRDAGASWQTMLGQQDEQAFRKLYPFSPALVEALVALSSSLQRERTAMKILMEILVEHIEDLKVGEVIRVGDLFDVLAAGDEPADGVMKNRFESAKQLYNYKFLPMIRNAHGTNTEARCQRLRDDHVTRLGCSNCGEKACRTDNRIVKTLLIAALVPEVDALKNMTASKLVQLNHGTLKVPVPGGEATEVAQRLADWASSIGQLKVGAGSDPTVALRLEGVDIDPILDKFRNADSAGARQRVLRDILFDAMGVDKVTDVGRDHTVDWYNTKRLGHLRFANVRKLGPDHLTCPEHHDWRLIVDYPFDDEGFGPNDDIEVLERYKDETGGSWTLVWLPSFFSKSMNDLLGELTILEHIFETQSTRQQAVSHLSVADQSRALHDLENLRSSQKARLQRVLEQAYGLVAAKEGEIDPAAMIEQHLYMLKPGAKVSHVLAPNLDSALEHYVRALLQERYPRHPKFTKKLTRQRIERLVEKFGDLIDSEEKRIAADKELTSEMDGTLAQLGLVRVTEDAVHLVNDKTLQELDKKRDQQSAAEPEVQQLRRWLDESGRMGLSEDAEDLVIRCYARWSARTFVQAGAPFTPAAGKRIPDDVVLEKPPLPPLGDWLKALNRAGETFGITLAGRALHADNLKRFQALLNSKLKEVAPAAAKVPALLQTRLRELDLPPDVDRMITAKSADQLVAALMDKPILEQVDVLAGFECRTSAKAVGRSLARAREVAELLEENPVFFPFQQLKQRALSLEGAAELVERAAEALRQDELNVALVSRLRALADEALRLLNPPRPGTQIVFTKRASRSGPDESRRMIREILAATETELDRHGEALELTISVEIRAPEED